MSRLWIAVDARIRNNAKVWEFAAALSESTGLSAGSSTDAFRTRPHDVQRKAVAEAIGYLVQLWGEVAEHRPDGDLARVHDALLEPWAGWSGEPGRFAHHFKRIFLNDSLINDWEEHNGRLLAMRERERKRGERRRTAKSSTGSSAGSSTGRSTDLSPANQNQNPNLQKPLSIVAAGASPKPGKAVLVPWVAEAVTMYAEHIGIIEHGRMGKALKPAVAAHGWPKVREWFACYCRNRPYKRRDGTYGSASNTEKDCAYCSPEDFVKTLAVWQDMLKPFQAVTA